jgi:hypothetical protein
MIPRQEIVNFLVPKLEEILTRLHQMNLMIPGTEIFSKIEKHIEHFHYSFFKRYCKESVSKPVFDGVKEFVSDVEEILSQIEKLNYQ